MKPYYDDGSCVIYHGDCRDVLHAIEHADVVLTDPPYGIEGGRSGGIARGKGDYAGGFVAQSKYQTLKEDWLHRICLIVSNAITYMRFIWLSRWRSRVPRGCLLAPNLRSPLKSLL